MDNLRQKPQPPAAKQAPQPAQRPAAPQSQPRPAYTPPQQKPPESKPAPPKSRPVEIPMPAPGKINTKQSPAMNLEPAKATAGKAGERHLAIEKFWIRVEGPFPGASYAFALPCGFNVKTLDGNELEVVMEQLTYSRTYNGKGSLKTQVIPVAPIGTKGRIIVRDSTSGETLEQPWTWYLIGGGGGLFARIWRLVKQSIWPEKT